MEIKVLEKDPGGVDLELAKMLIRPSGMFLEDMNKEGLLTEAKFGSVTRIFVVCEEDEVMKEEFQRWMIENGPNAEVRLIREAGHMVMLTKPIELCQCFCVGRIMQAFV
ncbi:unnamed protein product [Malus baccata var. baccata]